jgi:hypothetical protein
MWVALLNDPLFGQKRKFPHLPQSSRSTRGRSAGESAPIQAIPKTFTTSGVSTMTCGAMAW